MHAIEITKRGKELSLDAVPTQPKKRIDHEHLDREVGKLSEELGALQELLWGARTHSVLVVLQGRDAAGKDGAIKRVAGSFNNLCVAEAIVLAMRPYAQRWRRTLTEHARSRSLRAITTARTSRRALASRSKPR